MRLQKEVLNELFSEAKKYLKPKSYKETDEGYSLMSEKGITLEITAERYELSIKFDDEFNSVYWLQNLSELHSILEKQVKNGNERIGATYKGYIFCNIKETQKIITNIKKILKRIKKT